MDCWTLVLTNRGRNRQNRGLNVKVAMPAVEGGRPVTFFADN